MTRHDTAETGKDGWVEDDQTTSPSYPSEMAGKAEEQPLPPSLRS